MVMPFIYMITNESTPSSRYKDELLKIWIRMRKIKWHALFAITEVIIITGLEMERQSFILRDLVRL